MAFTVQEFHDLVQLLYERADWRAELRHILLTDELLALPELVRELGARVEQVIEAQARTDAQLATLTARVDMLTQRFEEQTSRFDALILRMDRMAAKQDEMLTEIGSLKGESLELRCERRAGVYFDDLLSRATPVPSGEFARRLEEAMLQGVLSPQERRDAVRLDLLGRGEQRPAFTEAYLAVEISSTIREKDVRRAARRADLLRRIYGSVMPVAAGEGVTPKAREQADDLDVQLVLDGRALDEADE